jgi:hypothetical protein
MVRFMKDFAALEKWLAMGKRFYTITTSGGMPMRQCTKKPLRRGTRGHRLTSGYCIRRDRVCQKTMCERICGTASQQPTHRVTRRGSQQIIEL